MTTSTTPNNRRLPVAEAASMVVHSNPLVPPLQGTPAPIGTPLHELAPQTFAPLMLRVNGAWLLRAQWWRPVLPGDVIEWHELPMGGGNGNGSRQVLTLIAVIVISYFTMGAGYGAFAAAGTWQAAAIGAVLTVAATAVINALVPIQQPVLGTTQSAGSVYNVATASNQARLAQPIPVIYGRMLVFPDYAGQPYSRYDTQNDQYFYAVFCIGQGKYNRERFLIDDTPIDHYRDVNYEWLDPGQLPTIAQANVVNAGEVIGQTLFSGRPVGWFAVCGPGYTVSQIELDVVCPKGLGLADSSGTIGTLSLSFRATGRYVDDWGTPLGSEFTLGNETITRATNTPQRLTFTYTPPSTGRIEVRVVRSDTFNASNYALHDLAWTGLRGTLGVSAPLCPTATHAAIRIRATEQLSGTSQRRISAIVRRLLRTWSSGGGWTAEVETRNPMWARLDKLSSAAYGDGLADARIDLQTHADLAAVYDTRQDHLDILFDSKVTSIDADRTICMAGRAMPFQRAGVCTLTRDQLQTLPVTAYTSRDMLPHSLNIGYALATEVTADAVNLEYFSNRSWDWQTILCKAPGVVTPANAVRQRVMGITGAKHAQREGLYMAAQNVYRRKFAKFTTEMRGLLPAYGSLVILAPALPSWGQAGDVAFWDLPSLTMGLSEPAVFTPGARHYVSLRRDDGTLTAAIAATPGPTEYDIVLASAPDFTLVLDDANRERPKFIFGAEGQHRIGARVLGIRKAGRGADGAMSIEISTVAENNLVHAVDNALLPGPGEIQDSVNVNTTTGETAFTYVVDLDARNSSSSPAFGGIRIVGIGPDWVLTLDLPTGQKYSGWSAWASDYSSEVPSPPTAWGNAFSVTNGDGSTAAFGTMPIATTGPAACAAFAPVTISGYASYTFWISDSNPGDNRGGLSIRVTKI